METDGLRKILTDHAHRYPEWQAEDVYKLLHQATMGSEHAAVDEAAACSSLARELAMPGPGSQEPLLDPVSPDGMIMRLHLRPYAEQGLDVEILVRAFVRTAREFRGSLRKLARAAEEAVHLAREGRLLVDENKLEPLLSCMQEAGFPHVHHSSRYAKRYRPAYRVVACLFLPHELVGSWLAIRGQTWGRSLGRAATSRLLDLASGGWSRL